MNELQEQHNTELQSQRQQMEADNTKKEHEIAQLLASQHETDRHFQGAMHRIADIRNSLSYRLGMFLTWPVRKIYDGIIEPFSKYPGNLERATQIVSSVVRHPLKSLRLLSWERIRNAYITFFKNPASAGHVVAYYSRLLDTDTASSASGLLENLLPINSPEEPQGGVNIPVEAGNKVSLIVVNFNGRHHLADLLSSLCAQDYDDFEIIFVDNGSSDNSVEYIRKIFLWLSLLRLRKILVLLRATTSAWKSLVVVIIA